MRTFAVLFLMVTTGISVFCAEGKMERVYNPTQPITERVAGQPPENIPPVSEWDSFQIGFAPNLPSRTENSNVYGLKLGLPFSSGRARVWGTEISLFSSSTDHIKGFQTSVFANVCKFLDGMQAGLVNVVMVTCDGFQLGLVNYSDETGFQIGLVNIIPKGTLPFMLLVNFQFAAKRSTYIQEAPEPE